MTLKNESTQEPVIGRPLAGHFRSTMQVSYALRRVPDASLHSLIPAPEVPEVGDIVLARVESIGKNVALDIRTGRRSTLHEGSLIAAVFGNRYASLQFEGYARADGDRCHLLSVGGLCGMVATRHDTTPEPTRLRIKGSLAGPDGLPLRLQNFALPHTPSQGPRPRVAVVLGTSMDAGKTYTARSVILGLQRQGIRVAAIKLTGTAAGRDSYVMRDAGACVVLDFVDGGLPSTFLCPLNDLLSLYRHLVNQAAAAGAAWVVVEIADGVVQGETAALLGTPRFTTTVDAWLLAAVDALGALGGQQLLRKVGVTPLAVSGVVSRSALCRREVEAATNIPCKAASELEAGGLNARLLASAAPPALEVLSRQRAVI